MYIIVCTALWKQRRAEPTSDLLLGTEFFLCQAHCETMNEDIFVVELITRIRKGRLSKIDIPAEVIHFNKTPAQRLRLAVCGGNAASPDRFPRL
ncbi:hypothetical protein NDU88_000611 [Pleurodeles waltl]|uniref:Uncharacterized protein n=1 Tax=Pleurodeles waltl TaxID=8319 RepID=A0AAV7MJ38_PLEWA|nr:hypothetical protein NDU88_000611 [Pleurodeles waltl]